MTIYPGISADVVRNFLRQPVKALILRSYGVGNAPQNGEFIQGAGGKPASAVLWWSI
ncbi:hypothetical protein LNP20_11095 [Klebsiella pneumoniae subsp. pneumoniae]|nr:hypothetical protein [Klebsiella pneumoniae subsp. pneumoniae]